MGGIIDMHYLAIDFELANSWSRSSACSVGIVEINNNVVINEFYSLINPLEEFEQFCIDIHGILPEMVEDQPTFKELWPDLEHLLKGNLAVAHNASFDMSVLRHCLNANNLQFPKFNYACSYLLSKRIYTGLPSYRLNYLIDHHDLGPLDHHHALSDAKAAADLFNQCMVDSEFEDMNSFLKKHNYRMGSILPDNTYKAFRSTYKSKSSIADAKHIKPTTSNFDEDHLFYEKNFVFTGTLKSMNRKVAMQKVVNVGGLCGNGVTLKTNYLVVGVQDLTRYAGGASKSSKMIKAEKYAQQGQDIEIIAEDDFLNSL